MKFRIHELVIHCKHSQEVLPFGDFNYFHGRMGAGKSTIARLIDFCLGGALAYTPALQAEFVSASIDVVIGRRTLTLVRNSGETKVRAQWTENDGPVEVLVPAREPGEEVIPKSDIKVLSDLIFYLGGIDAPMVRRSKARFDSQLVRLSLRDLLWYCYLDQDSMDSSFFRLDDSNHVVRLKSVDVLRLVIGFHQQVISELQVRLETVRAERQRLETAASAIKEELTEDHLARPEEIDGAIAKAKTEQETIGRELSEIRRGTRELNTHATAALREECRQMAGEIANIDEASREIEESIGRDKQHRNTLLDLAVRQKRAQGAREALSGVEFQHCPRCYQSLPERGSETCSLCGQVHLPLPSSPIDDSALESDVRSRVEELDAKLSLQGNALKRLLRQRLELADEKEARDKELNRASEGYDSAYLSQVLEREKRIARLGQRVVDLKQLLRLAGRVRSMEEQAKRLSGEEGVIRSQITEARELAERDTSNLDRLRALFLNCLLRAKVPGFSADDTVEMRSPWFLPEIIGRNTGDFAVTSYETLGSGGKKTLFKCCFALAVHLLAQEQGAPMPQLLIIDSPMKNISERENREQFEEFNRMLYELSINELRGTQFIVIDKEFHPPVDGIDVRVVERYMNPDDPEHPPLISRYVGK